MTVLECKDISYSYSRGTPFEIKALDGVSIKVEQGDMLAIIGHTGSGKSSLIQHFNALISPDSGIVLVEGRNINESKQTKHQSRFKVGLCFQYPEYQLFESTVYKDIAYGPLNMHLSEAEIDSRVRRSAEFTGISKDMLEKSPFDLSGGEKRRVALAGIMAMEPDILVLDEPAAGLDPAGRKMIFEVIENYRIKTQSTVIIVSHSMEDVALHAAKVLVMNKGRVADYGTVDEIFIHAEKLADMGLDIPQCTKIMFEIKKLGYDVRTDIYSVEEAEKELIRVLQKGGNGV